MMLSRLIFTALFILLILPFGNGQEMTGTWKTVDDVTGEEKSYVTIEAKDGKYVGFISKLLQESEDVLCENCPGEKRNTKVLGLEIIWDMELKGDKLKGGRILDPENGKTYKCKISLEDDGVLNVRGFIGISALGRTQKWYRVDE